MTATPSPAPPGHVNLAAGWPRADDPAASDAHPARQSKLHAQRPPASHSRRETVVLIVDDSPDAREMYALYLGHSGYRTHTASDGGAAVDLAVQITPDIVVMDLSMPTVDGITATQRMRQLPQTRDIPVILLTGYPQKAIERGALEAGVDVLLTKPCLPEDVEVHVRRLLESKRRT